MKEIGAEAKAREEGAEQREQGRFGAERMLDRK